MPEPNAPPGELEVHFSARRASGVKVTIQRRAVEAIAGFATRRGGWTEEGGVVAGRVSSVGDISIADAAGPGPRSERTATSYRADGAHDLAFVTDLNKWLGGGNVYRELGMWHTHPTGTARPSGPDLQHFARMHQLLGVSAYLGLILTPRGNGLTATAWITSEGDPLARDPWYRCGPAELTVEGKSWPA